MTEEQVLQQIQKMYPHLEISEITGVSVIDNGNYAHVAAHAPIREAEGHPYWNHRYFQFTIDLWNFKRCIYEDSNVTDSDNFKTAEETRVKASNYFEHVLQRL